MLSGNLLQPGISAKGEGRRPSPLPLCRKILRFAAEGVENFCRFD
jgi:hypothetical protein